MCHVLHQRCFSSWYYQSKEKCFRSNIEFSLTWGELAGYDFQCKICNIFCTALNTFLWVRRKIIYLWCLKIVILMHFFSWTVKLSSFSCVKELCRKFQSSDDNGTWPQDTTSLVQEVFLYSYSLWGFIFCFCICSPFSITPDKPFIYLFSSYFIWCRQK